MISRLGHAARGRPRTTPATVPRSDREHGGDGRQQQQRPAAVEQAGQNVAAERVGAQEPLPSPGRAYGTRRIGGRARGDERSDEREADDQQRERQADLAAPVRERAPHDPPHRSPRA